MANRRFRASNDSSVLAAVIISDDDDTGGVDMVAFLASISAAVPVPYQRYMRFTYELTDEEAGATRLLWADTFQKPDGFSAEWFPVNRSMTQSEVARAAAEIAAYFTNLCDIAVNDRDCVVSPSSDS